MNVGQPSAYEPFKHARDADDDNPEKPLVRDAVDGKNHMRVQNARRQASRGAPHIVRAILRTIVLLVAVTILAVQGHSMSVWLDTRHQSAYNPKTRLRTTLWAHLDSGPTWTMLIAALIAVVVHFLALLTLCLPVCINISFRLILVNSRLLICSLVPPSAGGFVAFAVRLPDLRVTHRRLVSSRGLLQGSGRQRSKQETLGYLVVELLSEDAQPVPWQNPLESLVY